MEMAELESGVTGDASIIPGLPDDVAFFCLARVPRKYHPLIRGVSRRWRDVVESEDLYCYRLKHNLVETWVYALCRDKSDEVSCYVLDPKSKTRCWRIIEGLPPQCLRRKGMAFEVLGRRCYLLGGCGWFQDATDEVYCYDAAKNSWDTAAPMSTARCYFACEALDQKLYTVGGVQSNSSDALSWDTYNPSTNQWTCHSVPDVVSDIEDSIVLDGKMYFRCRSSSSIPPHVYSILHEPSSGTWKHADEDMVSGWRSPAVVINETLYVLDQTSGTRLLMWEKRSREWISIGRLSPLLTRPPCQVAAVGKSIFIIGKGLSTVVFDVEKARNMGGVMVSSSIAGLASVEDVISCKTLTM